MQKAGTPPNILSNRNADSSMHTSDKNGRGLLGLTVTHKFSVLLQPHDQIRRPLETLIGSIFKLNLTKMRDGSISGKKKKKEQASATFPPLPCFTLAVCARPSPSCNADITTYCGFRHCLWQIGIYSTFIFLGRRDSNFVVWCHHHYWYRIDWKYIRKCYISVQLSVVLAYCFHCGVWTKSSFALAS